MPKVFHPPRSERNNYLSRLLSAIWIVFAVAVVLAALSLSIARLVITASDDFSRQVESQVAAYIGLPVSVERLEVAWQGIYPVLKLAGVQIFAPDSESPLLELREIHVVLDLFRSLLGGQLRPAGVTLIGAQLSLVRDEHGRIGLAGFPELENAPDLISLVLGQRRFALENVDLEWHDHTDKTPPFKLNQVQLGLNNRGAHRRLSAVARLPDKFGRSVQVIGDLRWDPDNSQQWNGALYVEGLDIKLPAWSALGFIDWGAIHGESDVRLWAQIDRGQLQQVQSEFTARSINWVSSGGTTGPLAIADSLSGLVIWRKGPNGWLMGGDELVVERNGNSWPEVYFRLSVENAAAPARQRIKFMARELELHSVLPLIQETALISGEQNEFITALGLQGRIPDMYMEVERGNDVPPEAAFSASFVGIQSNPVENIPGVSGVSGAVQGTLEKGMILLDSKVVTVREPNLFRNPIHLDRVSGDLSWYLHDNLLTIESPRLVVENEDVKTRTRIQLSLPMSGDSPFLNLQLALHDGDLGKVSGYLPSHIMSARVVGWLDHALVSGTMPSGAVLFHGRLSDFPFRDSQGTFQTRINVERAVLDYQKDWPRIEELAAEVVFRNQTMVVDAVDGAIYEADLLDTHAEIEDLSSSELQVRGNIRGPIADMLKYVADSPLGAEYGEPLGPVKAGGVGDLSLELRIPLRDKTASVGVKGRVKFMEDELRFIGPDLSFSQVEGELKFTEDGFDADAMEARLNNQLVQVRVGTRYDGVERETWVELTGLLGLIDRMKQERWPILSKQISGSAPWQATIRVPKKVKGQDRKPLGVELQSNLQGVQVNLPVPLGKTGQVPRSFELVTTLKGNIWGPIRMQYGDNIFAALKLRQGERAESGIPGAGLERGELKFGGEPAQLPDQPGLHITGRVSQLPVTEWIDLVVSDNQGSTLSLRLQGLEVEYLEGWELAVKRVKISASNTGANWNIQVTGRAAEGFLELRANEQGSNSLRIVMDRLEVNPGPKSEQLVSDPSAVPALDINVQQAVYSGINLGKLSIKTSPRGTGLHVESMEVETDWIQLQSAGDWLNNNGEQRSDFQFTVMGGDLGKLLGTFGYAGNVSGGETEAQLSASWKGSPAVFAPEILKGRLTVDIKKGQLLGVEPGAGRIFGLLSVQALPRRLSGDFGDLFKKGFGFDRITGSFALQEGDAYTDDLVIDGPAATIEISGRTGLAAADYDQVVTIIPNMRSSLPIAGAIAVSPVAGAAIFLADKIFAKPTGTRYRLTGSWDEPQLESMDAADKPENVFVEDYDS